MMSEFERTVERLRQRLTRALPGREVYMKMAPENREHRLVAEARTAGCREGSVLILLYPFRGEPYIVLTKRTDSLPNHAGQISLPGGRREPDEDAVACAVREAWEELGIIPEALDILGVLSELYIPPSNFCLTPVVAATHRRPDFQPHDGEVAELIEAPVRRFADPASRSIEQRVIRGEHRHVPYYLIEDHKVWGATAMLLTEFAVIWDEINAEHAG